MESLCIFLLVLKRKRKKDVSLEYEWLWLKGLLWFIISIAMPLLWLLYKVYMDAKAIVIEYLWAYKLFFGSHQAICKGSNNLDGGLKR